MANSYNGWPASPDGDSIGIVQISVAGSRPFSEGGYPGGVKGGNVATIFQYLLTRLHNEVEPMMTQSETGLIGYGCWGYQYRANVNNPSQLSCHASGSAVDYNAPLHGNGTSVGPGGGGGWSAEQYRKIQGILATLDGVVRWLTGNDPMHFEINGSESEVAAVAARLRGSGGGATPTQPEDWFDMATPADLDAAIERAIPKIVTAVWDSHFEGVPGGEGAMASVGDIVAATYRETVNLRNVPAGVSAVQRAVGDLPVKVWTQNVTDRGANQVLADLVSSAQRLEAKAGTTPPKAPPPPKTYTVSAGDTFNAIAGRFGLNPDQLGALNPQVKNRAELNIGDVLTVLA